MAEWTTRVGRDAAAHRVRYYRTWLGAWLSAVLGFGLVLVGGFNDLLVVTILGVVAFVVWTALGFLSFRELLLMNVTTRKPP